LNADKHTHTHTHTDTQAQNRQAHTHTHTQAQHRQAHTHTHAGTHFVARAYLGGDPVALLVEALDRNLCAVRVRCARACCVRERRAVGLSKEAY
jgi:ABC-type Zn2+ transport system substrate-binding protein/surface adhesin